MSETTSSTPLPRILVIADLFFSAKLKGEIQALSYEYKAALGPKQGIPLARELKPAAIVVSLDKKGLDFADFVRQLRADPATQSVPVIGFCGHLDVGRMNEARSLGCLAVSNGEISANFSSVLQRALSI